MATPKVPYLVVFDLDNLLWCGSKEQDAKLFAGAAAILKSISLLNEDGSDTKFAIASNNVNNAKSLLRKFRISGLFHYYEIHSGPKDKHFRNLNRKSGVPFHRMIFFDDQRNNCKIVSNLGVLAVHCPTGLRLRNTFIAALKQYSKWFASGHPPGIIVEDNGAVTRSADPPKAWRASARDKAKWRRSPLPVPSLAREIVREGYVIMNRSLPEHWCTKSNEDWRASFGAGPLSVAIAWQMIDPLNNPGIPDHPQVHHILRALKFMKTYQTDRELANNLGGICPKTLRKWTVPFIREMAQLCTVLVRWEDRKLADKGYNCLINVDGIHCPIQRKYTGGGGVNSKFYSKKSNDSALGYETATCIQTGKFVWVNGPFGAAFGDVGMFRQCLRQMLEEGEKAEADDGYYGVAPSFASIPEGRFGDNEKEKQKSTARRRHETSNKRLKQWGVLANTFRHKSLSFHGDCFRAVVAMTQIMLEEGEALFPLTYSV